MISAQCLTSCDDEEDDSSRVAVILGGDHRPPCGAKNILMAPKIKLSSGYEMPVLGFGTYKLRGYQCSSAVHCAVETGFRHFDTAYFYENEKEVGEALRTQIKMGNVSRENIFLTTKLWNTHHDPRDVQRICQQQLDLLGFNYIDLYLMHFPVGYKHTCDEILKPISDDKLQTTDVDYIDTWRAMEDLVKLGLVRSIGLSNFNMEQIQRIIQCSSSKPVVNQVEIWPGFLQKDLVDYCRYNGIAVTAYSPLGQPNREDHSPIYFFSEGMKRLVKKYKRSASQIVLRYLVEYGVIPIPKAANPLHIKQNLNIFDFKLEEADTRALRGIKPKMRIVKYEMVKDHPFYPFERDVDEDDQPNIKPIIEPDITNQPHEDVEEKEEDSNIIDE